MADYQPIPRSVHEQRGYCCKADPHCVHCPYQPVKTIREMTVDPRILEALKSGVSTTIHSDRMSMVPELTIQNVTIIYKQYQKR
jgi:hypothetical protein